MSPTVIKGLNFSDVPIDTHLPKGYSRRNNFYSADEDGLFQDQISYVTPPASPQNGLLRQPPASSQNRTPGTVRFHPSVNTRHPAHDEYTDNSATDFHWDREEQAAAHDHNADRFNTRGMLPHGRMSSKEAFQLVKLRIAPPGVPLCSALHVMFPAPRGLLTRQELCDQLVSMFDCDRIIAAQAVTWMDPNNEGIDFATFKKYMQAGNELGQQGAATPRTPSLSQAVQDRRDKRSPMTQAAPPLVPQWLPKVRTAHGYKDTESHLGPGMVPLDGEGVRQHGAMNVAKESHFGPGMVPDEGAEARRPTGARWKGDFDHLEQNLMPEEAASWKFTDSHRPYADANRSTVHHCMG